MTNEERIHKLSEAVIDLIDMIKDKGLEWVRDEALEVWEDICDGQVH